ncbi:hypothetical protein KJ567_00030 [Candidatus Bipolaricaulota bacterium]|nr:hypothetical protein [Candidatus Bipolaricaulota bacterium]
MNWKLMVLAAVMVVAVMGVFLTPMQDDGSRDVDYLLFVQMASGGSYADGVLTLDGVPTTVFFSDHPLRIVGHMPNEEFAAQWGDMDENDDDDSPGAILSIHDAEEAGAIITLLGPPSTSGQTISYTIEVVEGSIPPAFGPASLYIDTEEEDPLGDEDDEG